MKALDFGRITTWMRSVHEAILSVNSLGWMLIVVATSMAMSVAAWDPWHDWGGDYAYYLGVARNMHFDRPLETANIGVVAPSGFPWLLSKIAPVLEWDISEIKKANWLFTLFYFALILFSARYLKVRGAQIAFVVMATMNSWIWFYNNAVLTELLFLLLITAMMTLSVAADRSKRGNLWPLVCGMYAVAILACFFKQASLFLLFVPTAVSLGAWMRGNGIKVWGVFLTLLSSVALSYAIYNAGWFHAAHHAEVAEQTRSTFQLISSSVLRIDDETEAISTILLGRPTPWLGWLVFILLVAASLKMTLLRMFGVLAVAIAIALPIFYVPWQPWGGRYWFPLLGVISYLTIYGALQIYEHLPTVQNRSSKSGITLVSLAIAVSFTFNQIGAAQKLFMIDRDKGVFEKNAGEMFHWVHYNTEWGKSVCFFKPRILGYHANWNSVCWADAQGSPERLEAILEGNDFLVVSDQYRPETWEYFKGLGNNRVVFRNERFVIVGKP